MVDGPAVLGVGLGGGFLVYVGFEIFQMLWLFDSPRGIQLREGDNASTIPSSLSNETDTNIDRLANAEHGVGPVIV